MADFASIQAFAKELRRRNIFRNYIMEALSNGQTNNNGNGVSGSDIDLEFLPIIYEIIKSIERDPTHDNTQKPRDSQDTSAKILELEKKLNQARERKSALEWKILTDVLTSLIPNRKKLTTYKHEINQLHGIEHSQAEQLKQVENLRKQLLLKRQLINKYRNTFTFSIPKLVNNEQLVQKLSESYPIRRAAQLFVYYFNNSKPSLEIKYYTVQECLKWVQKFKKIGNDYIKKKE